MHSFVIAGTNSGCGKTTISIGLMHLLQSKGYRITPFKVGPDFIDPRFHEKVLNTKSYNIDSYMLSHETLKHLFSKHSADADIAIAEGVMGMYDGLGSESIGSTYETAKILELPVVLVINCKGLFQSVAAIVKGFCELKKDASVKGMILNNVSSDKTYGLLKEFIEAQSSVKCIGYLPPMKNIELESRHLGLIQAEEVSSLNEKMETLRETLEQTIDIETLLEVSTYKPEILKSFSNPFKDDLRGLHLAIARDKAFSFYYPDNLELLEEAGATLHYFSPLADSQLPEQCNAIYFGGGYPEVFADELSKNTTLLKEIKEKAEDGTPIFAECGGLMFLTKSIIQTNGKSQAMCGIFNCDTQMTPRLKRFGYAEITYNNTSTRCHEFHRSELINGNENIPHQYQLAKPLSNQNWECGLKYKNVLAGYAHIHFWSDFDFTKQIFDLWKKAII